MSWAEKFVEARGDLTQVEAAARLCGCPVRTVRDWEQGRRVPPEWVQLLVLARLRKARPRA